MTAAVDGAWFVYMLRCGNGALYTGITTDVARRVREHQAGGRRAARFTRAFAPVALAYACRIGSRSMAGRVEHRIKRLSAGDKAGIVSGAFPTGRLMRFLGLAA